MENIFFVSSSVLNYRKFGAWILHDHWGDSAFRMLESRLCLKFEFPFDKFIALHKHECKLTFQKNHHEKFIICQLSHLVNNEKFGTHGKQAVQFSITFSPIFAFCNRAFLTKLKKCIFCDMHKCIFMISALVFSQPWNYVGWSCDE